MQAVAPELRHPAARRSSADNPWSSADDPRYRDLPAAGPPTHRVPGRRGPRGPVPYWEDAIVPDLRQAAETDSAVLVAAHGNSIRALRKHLEGISDADIVGLEVPTGIPFRMLLDYDLTVQSSSYLGDPAAAAAAAAAVSRQAG